ncbi:MAG: hypothetical protein C0412_07360 [Flavobacterium sp.]|nr:hypothetical protein [Flavobacterium sp.]
MERKSKKLFCPSLVLGILLFSLLGCKGDDNPSGPVQGLPVLTTTAISSITAGGAISGGNISSDGGFAVTARGVCWSTGQTPTIADNKTNNGTGTGSFVSNITGLTENTTYYVRAYATNSNGTGYGSAFYFVAKRPTLEITYIANTGFLIKVNNKKILVDALFSDGGMYTSPSPAVLSQMRNAESPFDFSNLVLVSHRDLDHCDPAVIVSHLTNNPSAKAIVSSVTRDAIRFSQNISAVGSRMLSITPNLYSSIDTTVNGIQVKVMRLRHGDSDGSEENIGFLIKVDGFTIFHAGDSNGYVNEGNTGKTPLEEYKSMRLENENIDVAIVDKWYFWESTSAGIEIVKQCLKPKNLILCHFDANQTQADMQIVNNAIDAIRSTLPNIVVFNQSMEKKTFTK